MRRPAYTLMEMLLVLAVLVVAAAASAPALSGVMRNATLTSAADTVRSQWTRAHVQAMKTGKVHAFFFETGGAKYKTEPWASPDDEVEGTGAESGSLAPAAPLAGQGTLEKSLPEGVTFLTGDLAADNRSLALETELGQGVQDKTAWSRPILFYPDGSSSDAYAIVASGETVGIRVDLRGITAVVKVGQITSLEQLQQP